MMGIKLKSQKSGNWVGIAIVYPSGATETVAMVLMPPDGDWRSTIEFYDELVHYSPIPVMALRYFFKIKVHC